MKKTTFKNRKKQVALLGSCAVALLGLSLGAYAYQNTNEKPPIEVIQSENISPQDLSDSTQRGQAKTERQGLFVDGDTVHKAEGAAKVVHKDGYYVLSFEDFKVLDGPDVFVYLSPNKAGEELGDFASLGPLKSHSGDQTYTLPSNHADYKTVVIWCRAFGVTFATAELK